MCAYLEIDFESDEGDGIHRFSALQEIFTAKIITRCTYHSGFCINVSMYGRYLRAYGVDRVTRHGV